MRISISQSVVEKLTFLSTLGLIMLTTIYVKPLSQATEIATRSPATVPQPYVANSPCNPKISAKLFAKTELFVGLSKPDGSLVTEAEFWQFIDREVTPRFPEGLTLLSGVGQFRNTKGEVIREPSRQLIWLYPLTERLVSDRKIEEIRTAYKIAFQQQSVLRVDSQGCTSF
jgi:hypothetical protein